MARRPTRRQLLTRRSVALLLVVATGFVAYLMLQGVGSGGTSRAGAKTRDARTSRSAGAHQAPAVPLAIYAHTLTVRPDVATDLPRIYVPSGRADKITVIDPVTKQMVSQFSTGKGSTPQHIVPSFDLKTLWVLNNKSDSLVPIDAHSGAVGAPIAVNDPYNLYFTTDGRSAIVIAELHSRIDFRDPHNLALQESVPVPGCRGINHADFSADGSYLLLTCEYGGEIAKVNVATRTVMGSMRLPTPPGRAPVMATMPDHSMATSMPQDIRLGPDGKKFFVADMLQGGVHVIDGVHLRELGFIPTGVGAHSITPSHDGTVLYVANRGSAATSGTPHQPGSVSVISVATGSVTATWGIPGGGSPDMGNLTADGAELWLSGRFDNEVYAFNTATGALTARIPVPRGPHGLTVWPQPGRYSLGHTGNMR
ncbi:MAG: YncE family protein [Acidimicrobiia bacterium]